MNSLANIFQLSQGGSISADGPLAEQVCSVLMQEFSHEKMEKAASEEKNEQSEAVSEGMHQLQQSEQLGWIAHFSNNASEIANHDPVGLLYAVDPNALSSEELLEIASARAIMSHQQLHNSAIVYVRNDESKGSNSFASALEDFASKHGMIVCKSIPELIRRYFR